MTREEVEFIKTRVAMSCAAEQNRLLRQELRLAGVGLAQPEPPLSTPLLFREFNCYCFENTATAAGERSGTSYAVLEWKYRHNRMGERRLLALGTWLLTCFDWLDPERMWYCYGPDHPVCTFQLHLPRLCDYSPSILREHNQFINFYVFTDREVIRLTQVVMILRRLVAADLHQPPPFPNLRADRFMRALSISWAVT